MIGGAREQAVQSLLQLVTSAYAWKTAPSRRLKLWTDVLPALRPACFLFEGGAESQTNSNTAIGKRTLTVKLFIYTDAKDPTKIGASELNTIADALDTAIGTRKGSDMMAGRNTLGGTAAWCRIEGAILKEPGDLDGDGLMVVPVVITLP